MYPTRELRNISFLFIFGLVSLIYGADFKSIYKEAMDAKKEGRYTQAAVKFEEAAALQPQNAELLQQWGTVLAFAGTYPKAIEVLERARALDPKNSELRFQLARVRAWNGDYDDARKDFESLIADEPSNEEAHLMLARVMAWSKNFSDAEAQYKKILAMDLKSQEVKANALLGLGNLMTWQRRLDDANEYYAQAKEVKTDSAEVREQLRQVGGLGALWRLDTGYTYTTFTRTSRTDWHEAYASIGYQVNPKTAFHLTATLNDRFDRIDKGVEGGVDYRLTDQCALYLSGGGCPDANSLPEWKVLTGGSMRFWDGGEVLPPFRTPSYGGVNLGPSFLTFDYQHSHYFVGDADQFATGIKQYVTDRISISAKWLRAINLSGKSTDGWSLRAEWTPAHDVLNVLQSIGFDPMDVVRSSNISKTLEPFGVAPSDWINYDRFSVYIGMAETQESLSASAVDILVSTPSHAYFCGAAWQLTPTLGLRADYTREELRSSYMSHSINIGTTLRF
jgi:YaiO family outer membrane protein